MSSDVLCSWVDVCDLCDWPVFAPLYAGGELCACDDPSLHTGCYGAPTAPAGGGGCEFCACATCECTALDPARLDLFAYVGNEGMSAAGLESFCVWLEKRGVGGALPRHEWERFHYMWLMGKAPNAPFHSGTIFAAWSM